MSEGADWISSHDQALARFTEIAKARPMQFIVLYSQPGEETMGTTIFAQTEFLASSITLLVEALVTADPDVAPPPDKEDT